MQIKLQKKDRCISYIKSTVLLFLSLFFFNPIFAQNSKQDTSSAQNTQVRTYTTQRLTTPKPVIDGVLDDPCWKTGTWTSNFTQRIPDEGAKPTFKTYLKILYDNKNIYVAFRCMDDEPDKISKKIGRRDQLGASGEVVGFDFDSYFDQRTGFEFSVTASGQKVDLILTNPHNGNPSWDAVWDAKTGLEDSAWVAEFEIPLSQLRYSNEKEQTWGLHVFRKIERLKENNSWEVQKATGPGMIYQFGHLKGISNLPKSRRIELLPYTVGRLNTFEKLPGNPFKEDGSDMFFTVGLDAKIGISSNFTVDIAINPDFGQVEADPSVLNLTDYEVFYAEKRPFFLEGRNIFSYRVGNDDLFYSRRIGHKPTFRPALGDGEFIDYPNNTSILSAVKLSGKSANGLSIGFLQSVTNNEKADLYSGGEINKVTVEPLTSYTLARIQQDFNSGTTILGGIFTSTNRFLNQDKFNSLTKNAFSGGIDLLHQWSDKEFFLDLNVIGSSVQGNEEAIKRLQTASARYFQRPDASHLTYDSTLTSLSGHGGKIEIGKGSKGFWRYSTGVNWRSPGLELNDIGFMTRTDLVTNENQISYFVNQPVSIFRTYTVGLNQKNNWDYGFNYLSSTIGLQGSFEFHNKWNVGSNVSYIGEATDNHILRGGYAMKIPAITNVSLNIRTDSSKKLWFNLNTALFSAAHESAFGTKFSPGVGFDLTSALKINASFNYDKKFDNLQYTRTIQINGKNRYLLAKIDQKTLNMIFRVDYIITPELSVQYYGSPFASVGSYSKFKSITNPKADNYNNRFDLLNPVLQDGEYLISESGNESYTFNNPDFIFSQFRSNLVLRWEYLLGSELYLVWSREKTNRENVSGANLNDAFSGIKNVFSNNLFLIKLNYWFSG